MLFHSADAIANFFLERAPLGTLTQMHVQKLVFYSHGWYLALDPKGRPLTGEPVEAWKFGPVFRSLYREFADFGNRPINRKAREIRFSSVNGKRTFQIVEPDMGVEAPTEVDKSLALAVVERVRKLYEGFTAYELSNMTHAEGEPWRIIRDAMPTNLPTELQRPNIPNETIRECFLRKLEPVPSI